MHACENCGISADHVSGCFSCNHKLPPSLDELPLVWKNRFALIERAGGSTRANMLILPFDDRLRAGFNIWAFLFGALYFLAKGMWRRALSYTLTVVAISIIFTVYFGSNEVGKRRPNPVNLGGAVFFSIMANRSYYKHKVLNDRGWW
ncbi:DUF2628 domain-containing protein [Massilia sp. METH4]|uniref:DUF2628 domain-containing protein n=1 Tax=Massilia sp. METH4 TaxID=3123041 RepID=UPI0030CBF6E7